MVKREIAVFACDVVLAVLSTRARTGMCEVEAVKRLLASDDLELWTRAALECAVAGNPLDVSDALSNLAVAGIICLSEERVVLSRTARDLMCHLRSEVLPADAPWGEAGTYRLSAMSTGDKKTKEGTTNAEK